MILFKIKVKIVKISLLIRIKMVLELKVSDFWDK